MNQEGRSFLVAWDNLSRSSAPGLFSASSSSLRLLFWLRCLRRVSFSPSHAVNNLWRVLLCFSVASYVLSIQPSHSCSGGGSRLSQLLPFSLHTAVKSWKMPVLVVFCHKQSSVSPVGWPLGAADRLPPSLWWLVGSGTWVSSDSAQGMGLVTGDGQLLASCANMSSTCVVKKPL